MKHLSCLEPQEGEKGGRGEKWEMKKKGRREEPDAIDDHPRVSGTEILFRETNLWRFDSVSTRRLLQALCVCVCVCTVSMC